MCTQITIEGREIQLLACSYRSAVLARYHNVELYEVNLLTGTAGVSPASSNAITQDKVEFVILMQWHSTQASESPRSQ